MSQVLTGAAVLDAAKEVCGADGEIYLVVSYWGAEASKLFHEIAGDRLHVVLDVNAGGTDPSDLAYFMKNMGDRIKVHTDLHTKLYASATDALIGSANATRPGLQISTSARVEAVMRVTGEDATDVHQFAKAIYDNAATATKDHLRICKERYQRVPLGQSEFGDVKPMDLLSALEQHPEFYSHLPLLVTNHPIDTKKRDKAWKKQNLEDDGDKAREFDYKRWDCFGWAIDDKLDNELCLALHVGQRDAVYAALLRPLAYPEQKITFARRAKWSEVPGLSYQSHTGRQLTGSDESLAVIRTAINKLVRKDEKTDGDHLLVSDLIKAISKAKSKASKQ